MEIWVHAGWHAFESIKPGSNIVKFGFEAKNSKARRDSSSPPRLLTQEKLTCSPLAGRMKAKEGARKVLPPRARFCQIFFIPTVKNKESFDCSLAREIHIHVCTILFLVPCTLLCDFTIQIERRDPLYFRHLQSILTRTIRGGILCIEAIITLTRPAALSHDPGGGNKCNCANGKQVKNRSTSAAASPVRAFFSDKG